jgi:Protein of unknown function (DUF3306)
MTERDDENCGFLSRWSRRKEAVKQGLPVVQEAPVVVVDVPHHSLASLPPQRGKEPEAPPPLPTLEDVAQLTRESDFSRFVAPNVDAQVKNAAMKKLFTDPHFNVMDGLDTYIDDYNKFEALPKSMLRQMVQARALGLLDDELVEQDKPAADNPALHEDIDLQLQPHDAAGQPGAAEGATESGEPRIDATDDPHDPVPPRSA